MSLVRRGPLLDNSPIEDYSHIIPAHRGASSGDVPEGGAGSGFPPPWLVTTARGRHRGQARPDKCRGRAPRGATSRSQGTLRRLDSVSACRMARLTGASPAPRAISALYSPSVGGI